MSRDRRFWTTAITEFERSGLTQEAFAARQGVSVGTLRDLLDLFDFARAPSLDAPVGQAAPPAVNCTPAR